MYIDVIFRNKSKMTNRLYSYYSSEDVEVGMRVIVPFGKSNINKLALVVRINDNPRKDIDYNISSRLESYCNTRIHRYCFFHGW